ncbi:DUF2793 domain-containing protein [Phaeobacter sp. HF9A]|uniref:DUF2793 domain-containing protein n=1 Tax=Phaeobacter sp. HF9A TaxID=2721561 RepID=UPI00143047F0|nr:DUF2793 domain-containing protein [Phaeobacter sp. HF9A]NIZ13203.1 DUF2793 domain-containing protein [Phaeobacter sp. HF9A]
MSQSSPRLTLPYLQPAQAQKHVTHNEALQRLDALVQLVVQEVGAETPPASPDPGVAYALGANPSGLWAGQGDQIAIFQGEGWLFLPPQPGWRAWDLATQSLHVWDGSAWGAPDLPDMVDQLGVATSANADNRLAVSSDAVLFTHAGDNHQLKLNKASDGDTASLLFQSNWSGHAEMGLAGSTDFSIKVSGGGSWPAAMVVKSATARVGFGTYSPGARLDIAHGGSGDDYLLAGEGAPLFRLAADGNGSCAGAWSGGGADYAEYFEWLDGNPEGEDRRGLAVLCEGEKIRPARAGETPIGVVSAAPCVIGNDDGGAWAGRDLRDAYGAPCLDAAGQRRRNPAYDPTRPYQPRATRREWDLVGLIGRLHLRQGQPVDPRWIRLRTNQETGLDLWLLR